MSALLALLAAAVYGAADFLGGLLGRRLPILIVLFWSQVVGMAWAVVVSLALPGDSVRMADVAWGVVGGLVGSVGLFALYHGLAVGRMSVVSPVAALLTALLPLGVGIANGERPTAWEWTGIALALPAIWLVASTSADPATGGTPYPDLSSGPRRLSGVWLGLIAGIGFGFFFIALAQTGEGAGFWPLVGARFASFAVAGPIIVARRLPLPRGADGRLVALVGTGDIAANVLLLLAFRSGLLTLVAVLAALYPAATVLLAVGVLGEAIGPRQRLGLVAALVAIVLIAT
ncbi:MAG TPA: DMT family transporter [Acidimicrobiia bacterium]